MKTTQTSEDARFIVALGVSPDVEGARLAARMNVGLRSDVVSVMRVENIQVQFAGLEATALRQARRPTLRGQCFVPPQFMICCTIPNAGDSGSQSI